jgi:hypothetical protein
MYLRRALLLAAAIASVWTVAVAFTGGFTLGPPALRVSSHDALRPLLAGIALAALYFRLHRQHADVDLKFLAGLPWQPAIATMATLAALMLGIELGGFSGAGPDPSGYVSQADKWAHGGLSTPVPEWARRAPWDNAIASSVPVGYVPDGRNSMMVPSYAPGLPLVMAVFERVGGRDAVFYVVPLFGALAVWMTYALGRRLASPWSGALASILLLSSPPFLWMLIVPMSDVPATACWITAIVFALRARTRDAIASGIATAVAILIRPNIVPLAIVPALLLLTNAQTRVRRIVLFGVTVLPAALFIAALNSRWYGSPLKSGYGALDGLYSLDRLVPNLKRYGSWFLITQTPIALLWLAAPFVQHIDRMERVRMIVVTILFPVAVLAMYVTYLSWDTWFYLRFLLPAFPAVCVGLAAVFTAFVQTVRPRIVAIFAVSAVTLSLAIQQWVFVTNAGLLQEALAERRFARASQFANTLPANSVLVSDAYSGTLHFYAGRDVLRWVLMNDRQFDFALHYLKEQGRPVYFIGDPGEGMSFRNYLDQSDAAALFERGHYPDIGEGYVASDLSDRP